MMSMIGDVRLMALCTGVEGDNFQHRLWRSCCIVAVMMTLEAAGV